MTNNYTTDMDLESFVFYQLLQWQRHFAFPIPEDPLNQTFASQDPEVLRLKVDSDYYRNDSCAEISLVTIFCPCGIPIFALQGAYCIHAMAVMRHLYDDVANARQLILRENSLIYKIEKDATQGVDHTACCLDPFVEKFERAIELVFTLDDPIELVKRSRRNDHCIMETVIVVRYKNLPLVSVYAKEADIDQFIERFNSQREIAREKLKSANLDQNQRMIHEAILDFYNELVTTEFPENRDKEIRKILGQEQAMAMYGTFAQKLATLGFSIEGYAGTANYAGHSDTNYTNGYAQRVSFSPVAISDGRGAPLMAEIVRDDEVIGPGFNNVKSLVDYSVQDVQNVLNTSLGLSHLCLAFEKANVDGALLKVMDDESLKELGVSSSMDRKKILAWVLKAEREGA